MKKLLIVLLLIPLFVPAQGILIDGGKLGTQPVLAGQFIQYNGANYVGSYGGVIVFTSPDNDPNNVATTFSPNLAATEGKLYVALTTSTVYQYFSGLTAYLPIEQPDNTLRAFSQNTPFYAYTLGSLVGPATPTTLSNMATNGVLGGLTTAGIDGSSQYTINQTTASITATLPTPTYSGKGILIRNIGSASITVQGIILGAGTFKLFQYATSGGWKELASGSATDTNAFHNGGDSFGTTSTIGNNDNFDFQFKANNISRGSLTKTGKWIFGGTSVSGGFAGTVNSFTTGRESPQLMLKSAGSGADSIQFFTGSGTPNGTISGLPGSIYVDGLHNRAYINQDGAMIWYPVKMNKDTAYTTEMVVLSSNYLGGSNADDLLRYSIPTWLNGWKLIDYRISCFSNGYTSGSTSLRVQQNAVNLTGISFGVGNVAGETGGITQTVASGDVLTLDSGTDTATGGSLVGLGVTLIFEKPIN